MSSIPNPFMLPFAEAGGAISGANFGVFYTVLMQIGYQHFGKQALKRLDAGESLTTILFDIQRQMQPFNDAIISQSMDRVVSLSGEIADRFGNALVQANKDALDPDAAHSPANVLSNLFKMFQIPEAHAAPGSSDPLPNTFQQHANVRNSINNYSNMNLTDLRAVMNSLAAIGQKDSLDYLAAKDAYNKLAKETRAKTTVESTRSDSVKAPTREATTTEKEFSDYMIKVNSYLSTIIWLKKEIMSRRGDEANLVASATGHITRQPRGIAPGESERLKQQRDAALAKAKSISSEISKRLKELSENRGLYQRFLQLSRNSRNHLIKSDANRRYNAREWNS